MSCPVLRLTAPRNTPQCLPILDGGHDSRLVGIGPRQGKTSLTRVLQMHERLDHRLHGAAESPGNSQALPQPEQELAGHFTLPWTPRSPWSASFSWHALCVLTSMLI